MPLFELKKELDVAFRVIDYVSSLALNGGDAMCNPECCAMLEYIGGKYLSSKVGTVEIYTNAIIQPDEHFLNTIKKYNAYIRFTDYGDNPHQRIADFIKLMTKYDIRYDHVRYSEWCDMGYPQESNGLKDEEDLQNHFNTCDRRSCQLISKGRFFYCSQAMGAERAAYCPIIKDDYFSLLTKSLKKKEFIEFALGYSNNGFINYCRKCNGSYNTNNKRVAVGIQVI